MTILTGSFSSVKTFSSNEIMKEVANESYSGKLAYSHAFARDNFFKPFKWLNGVPIIGKKLVKLISTIPQPILTQVLIFQ